MKRTLPFCSLLLVFGVVVGFSLFAVMRHPMPGKMELAEPLVICGHRIQLPVSYVGYADGLLDGGTMIFGIKDGAGEIYGVVCMFGNSGDNFRVLKFSKGLPIYDGTSDPVLTEITDNPEQVRNFIFHSMKSANFHNDNQQHANALNLYPSLYQRFMWRNQ